jgi:hypothetical protein
MRFIDIAVASGYAALCLSIIVLMNPVSPHEAAVVAESHWRLDSAISAYVGSVGLPFLATSPLTTICDSAARASNNTLILSVSVDGSSCASGGAPSSALASSSLTLDLPGRTVVIDAWLARQ